LLRLQFVVSLEVETAQGGTRFRLEPVVFVDMLGVDDEWWDVERNAVRQRVAEKLEMVVDPRLPLVEVGDEVGL
jgi:hypothetical protein